MNLRANVVAHLSIGDCWEWTASTNKWGYGQVMIAHRNRGVHRYVWEQLVGPIPEGMQLDHLCRNRRCANPDHLEVVTPCENVRRGYKVRTSRCVKGHEDWVVTSQGRRQCRRCNADRQHEYRVRLRLSDSTPGQDVAS